MKQILKQSLLLVFALILVFSLVACTEDRQPKEEGDDADVATKEEISFSVTYQGTVIELGKPADAVLTALGEPLFSEEVFDCGAGKSRMQYQFSSFDLYTMKSDDGEVIDQIELYDDQTETVEKISLGSEEAIVRATYGTPTLEKDGTLTYSSGENHLMIELKNGKVSAIGLLRKTN